MTDAGSAITAHDVRKNYGGTAGGAGLNGFDLRVGAGSVCGLLGPNGAGKTTAVRILSTLLDMDAGRASVAGFDVRRQGRQVRERIGLVGQYAAVDEVLTGRRNLVMFGRLNRLPAAAAARRADELLERFSLTGAARRPASGYSGGMRRRLDLAASLIVSPPVLFVDEPTTGLDPAARQEVWTAIRELVDAGTTVLLTTQYLEEADRLADRVCMLAAGRVVAEGTPDELKSALGGDRIDLVLSGPEDTEAARAVAARIASGEPDVDRAAHRIGIPVTGRVRALIRLATELNEAGIEPEDLALRRPTLDEVFLHLTGGTPATGTAAGRADPAGGAGVVTAAPQEASG
ncbi:ATP-binding cassette domain-containing protein [Planomonospora parontospora]|uniref:ATP-binding cassette domain-containing protein n=1 Tax=Planomonospora parontospora TaxID=58119 RepID=UPI00166FE2DC|nr:ATP-binding cassette domain-containing protein [Planomonospora parontospora]GGL25800.1 daunorubicin resistance protein DrrA family ABC transporter ATP-binding protein [Planomonospora parontospora subsp. antibiotica]GII16031.1 daunorubicin resistance protein DrrA family ABC transporter ATP-binding protein [Planomonospora parontospora subsp. antibiotica]